MKQMKELRSLDKKELEKRLEEFKKELLKLNGQVWGGAGASNPGRLHQLKKTIARINALMHEQSKAE